MMKAVRSIPPSWYALIRLGMMIFLIVMFVPHQAGRATSSVLYAAPTAQGNGDCLSWATACTLQTALSNAVSGDEIWVKAGVHYPGSTRDATFVLKNGVAIYGGFNGTEDASNDRNWQSNKTILSGDIDHAINPDSDTNSNGIIEPWLGEAIVGNNAYHVVTGVGTNNTSVLDGFIITAGQANGSTDANKLGGGMYNSSSSPTITNIIFSGNIADSGGGGMSNYNSSPILRDIIFHGNISYNVGGGMYNIYYTSPTLINVTFSDNTADNVGGGIYNEWHSNPMLKNVIFNKNTAINAGGGIANDNSSPTLINVTFSDNSAQHDGGGIHNYWYSNPTLTNVIIWGSSIGSIYNKDSNSNPNISYSDIQGCGGSGSGWQSYCGINGGHNIDSNPLFEDSINGNLHLRIGSPAIDSGTNTSCPATDLDGLPRPADGNGDNIAICDMGAYETQLTKIYLPLTLKLMP